MVWERQQTLLTVQPKCSAFLVVHAVSRFSATRARAGGTVFPYCRVSQPMSCNDCKRLHLLLRRSLTLLNRTAISSLGLCPFENHHCAGDATSRQSLIAGVDSYPLRVRNNTRWPTSWDQQGGVFPDYPGTRVISTLTFSSVYSKASCACPRETLVSTAACGDTHRISLDTMLSSSAANIR